MDPVGIVHRDEHLAIVDKPAGLLVVPAPARRGPTLIDVLARQLGCPVHAVHRLDEETTGALVVALTDSAKVALEGLFREHTIRREYLALLSSAPSPPAGTITSNLQEDASGVVRVVRTGGVKAVTHYETLQRRGRCTLVLCRLETGRRNQIRVHMAALGCPVAGDRKYGRRGRGGDSHPRVMLHSWRVQFRHPITGARVDATVPPAEADLQPDP
jgi:23S rRNA pseudouridine1911/1915/1917 synthase